MKKKVITSITTQPGKQITVVHERGILNRRWSLNRTRFSKENFVYNFFKSKELFDLYSESLSLIKQLVNKADLCLNSSTTLLIAFSKIETSSKAEYWYLNLKRKCSDLCHGGEDVIYVGICIPKKFPALF